MSTISASTTSTTAYKVTADTTGTLVFQTGATPTTALTIGSDQSVTFAGAQTYTGGATFTSGITVQGLTVGKGAGAVSTNTAVGASALATNSTGVSCTAVSYQAVQRSTVDGNTAMGRIASQATSTGAQNTAVGSGAAPLNTTGTGLVAIGANALGANTTGSSNVGVGRDSLASNTTASNNTAVGYQAGYTNSTGTGSVYLGQGAGYSATGSYNTIVGREAGYSVSSGGYNTFLGQSAGYYVTTGAKNTVIGQYNGNQGGLDLRTASNYIVLSDGDGNPRAWWDNNAYFHINNTNNRSGTSIYYAAADVLNLHTGQSAASSQSLLAGWNSATSTSTGNLCLNVVSNGNITNSNNSYGGLSDIKLKENIVDATPKLEKLCQVRVVNYNLKEGQPHKQIGVIAQELEQVFPGMVEESPDRDEEGNDLGTTTKSVKYSVFVPMLVKAIQELKAEFDAYKEAHP